MRKLLGAVIITMFAAVPAFAQAGLSPLVQNLHADKHNHASGEFQIVNNGLTPVASVVEVRSFSVDAEGKGVLGPVDGRVTLSQTSARVPPKSSYTIGFDVSCPTLPCAFQLIAFSSGARKQEGSNLTVRTGVGGAIYVSRKTIQKGEVVLTWVDSKTLEVLNNGGGFDRPEVDEVTDGKTKLVPSFPLFPNTKRTLRFDAPPSHVTLRFANFKVETRP